MDQFWSWNCCDLSISVEVTELHDLGVTSLLSSPNFYTWRVIIMFSASAAFIYIIVMVIITIILKEAVVSQSATVISHPPLISTCRSPIWLPPLESGLSVGAVKERVF